MTLTTIGFGDFIMEPSEEVIVNTFFFIFFGLALVGAAIGLATKHIGHNLANFDEEVQRAAVKTARAIKRSSLQRQVTRMRSLSSLSGMGQAKRPEDTAKRRDSDLNPSPAADVL